MKNEILEEIWRAREELAREHNHDLHAIVMAIREMEKHPLTRVVNGPEKRERATAATRGKKQ